MRELTVLVPKALTSVGQGVVSFVVEIEGNAYREWKRRCRVEGVPDVAGSKTSGEFLPNGMLPLFLPGDLTGEILPVLELEDRRTGARLSGAFRFTIQRRSDQQVHVHAASHQVDAQGVVYQPIEIGGIAGSTVEVVGDRVRVSIELVEEEAGSSVPLSDLAAREGFLTLPQQCDGAIRTLSVRVGPRLSFGRCFARQLREAASARLGAAGFERVDWVTHWDDPDVPQVSAAFGFTSGAESAQLEVENLTDYSRAKESLNVRVAGSGSGPVRVAPGTKGRLELGCEVLAEIGVGDGSREKRLLAFTLDEVAAGAVTVPVIRAGPVAFEWPPGSEAARPVAWFGIWIPWAAAKLERVLATLNEQPVPIGFPAEAIHLWLRYSSSARKVLVSGTAEISEALGRG